jgi:hypothetical protein
MAVLKWLVRNPVFWIAGWPLYQINNGRAYRLFFTDKKIRYTASYVADYY